jgi:L-serine/L-threonine ammonia-lyase
MRGARTNISGVGNMVRTAVAAHPRAHFYISSGGNAGIACVLAAARYGRPATVVVPLNALPLVTTNLRAAGAKDVILAGASWREADAYLRTVLAADADGVYVPPFDHPDVWAGAATMGAEIEAQLGGTADVVVASVGGGGLFSGLMQGLSADTRVVAVETEGAASLHASVRAGHLVTLPAITSIATSLGATRVAPHAFQQAQRPNVTTTTVTDAQAVSACARFLDDHRMLVEAACGATLALVYSSLLQAAVPGLKPESRVVLVVCGGSNIDMRLLAQYRKQFNV